MHTVIELIKELKEEGISHPLVLEAIKHVPRENFMEQSLKKSAYVNTAFPIACQQTISQPYIVALMTQALLENTINPEKILEIGTGSGYQAAILAMLFKTVYTVERIPALYQKAKIILDKLGFENIFYKLGDGAQGWEEHAPYDGIIVTAAAKVAPPKLLAQLKPEGGVMVIPLGEQHKTQILYLVVRQGNNFIPSVLTHVRFVPLIEN